MLHLYQDVLKSFHSRKVKYVVIGGIAVGAHGLPRNTFDLDVLIEATEENAKKLLDAMIEARYGSATLTNAATVAKRQITIFLDRLRIDVITDCPGLTFATAWKNKVANRRYGFPLYFASIDDLIRAKRAAGRPQDLEDVAVLTKAKIAGKKRTKRR